jgi:hypothetical protein
MQTVEEFWLMRWEKGVPALLAIALGVSAASVVIKLVNDLINCRDKWTHAMWLEYNRAAREEDSVPMQRERDNLMEQWKSVKSKLNSIPDRRKRVMPKRDEIQDWPTTLIEYRLRDWERVLRVWRRTQVRGQRTITRFFALAPSNPAASRERPTPPAQHTGQSNADERKDGGKDADSDDDGAVAEGTSRQRARTAPSTPPKQQNGKQDDGKRQRSPKVDSESKRNKKAAKANKSTLKRKWAPAPTADKRTRTDTRLHFAAPQNTTPHTRNISGPDDHNTAGTSTPTLITTHSTQSSEDDPGAAAAGTPVNTSEPTESGEIRPATPAELAREEPGQPQASPRPHGRVPTTSTDRREDQPG